MSSISDDDEDRRYKAELAAARAAKARRLARQTTNPPPDNTSHPVSSLNPPSRVDSSDSLSSTTQLLRDTSLRPIPLETNTVQTVITSSSTDDDKDRTYKAELAAARAAKARRLARQSGQGQSKPQTIIINDDLDDVTRAAAKLKADLKQFIPSGPSPLPSSPSAPKTLSLFFKPDTEGSYDANQLWVYYDPIDTAQLQDFVQEEEEETKTNAGTLSTEKDYDDDDRDNLLLNERVAILSKVLVLYSRADMVRCFKEFADAKVVKDVDGKSFMNAEEMDKYLCVYLGMLSSNDPSKLPQSITIIQNIITSMKQHIGDRPCLDQMERLLDQLYKE
jgi:hypothetical protein